MVANSGNHAPPLTVSYVTDDPAPDYAKAVSACTSRAQLIRVLRQWKKFAPDALTVALAMRDEDWDAYQKGLKAERRGQFAGDEWAQRYGAILLPEKMFHASAIADRYKVPWGTAWIRIKEAARA